MAEVYFDGAHKHLEYQFKDGLFLKYVDDILIADVDKKIRIYISSGRQETYDIMMNFNTQYASIIMNNNLNHSTTDFDWAMYKDDKKNGRSPMSPYESRKRIWLYIKWHLLLSDSIYNVITFCGACTIVLVMIFCKIS